MQSRGFGLLEVLVAIIIIAILTGLAIGTFSNYNRRTILDEARAKIVSEINLVRTKTLASEDKSSWGVHFEASSVTRFKGSSYSPSDSSNVTVAIPIGATISVINLGGSNDVIFERLTGRALNTGFIIIQLSSDPTASTTIDIYASGIAE